MQSMEAPALRVDGVSKTYHLWSSPAQRLLAPLWLRLSCGLDALGMVGLASRWRAWARKGCYAYEALHEISFTLTPGQGTEYKLVMNAGAIATFEFFTQGGAINFDQHGEGEGQSFSYEVLRGVEGDSGTMQAPVAGTHGWFFRNRGTSDVTVTLRTGGDYIELRKLI